MPEDHRRACWAELVRHARCAREAADPDLWFPVSVIPAVARREAADAIAICRGCAVRSQCLELSLRHWNIGQHGIWGGLLPVERAEIRRLLLLAQAGAAARCEESA